MDRLTPRLLYGIWTPKQGYVYIGVTGNLLIRWQRHRHAQSKLGQFVRKHHNIVTFRPLALGPAAYIYALEKRAIRAFDTRLNGFNRQSGGGKAISKELFAKRQKVHLEMLCRKVFRRPFSL